MSPCMSPTLFSKDQKIKYQHYIEAHGIIYLFFFQHPNKNITKAAAVTKYSEYIEYAELIPGPSCSKLTMLLVNDS